jgi:hypothetical protein
MITEFLILWYLSGLLFTLIGTIIVNRSCNLPTFTIGDTFVVLFGAASGPTIIISLILWLLVFYGTKPLIK